MPYLTLPGMKMVFFWIRRNIQKMFPWIYKGFNFWSWVVWGRAKSSFSGIQRWNYCILLFRHFLAPKYLFCYAVSSFLYYILSVFLLATCMHAKVWHFFLNNDIELNGDIRRRFTSLCVSFYPNKLCKFSKWSFELKTL